LSSDVQTPPAEDPSESSRQEVRREVVEFVKMVVWFLVLFLVLKTYVIEGYEVQGPSMEPTLHDRERILVFKLPHLMSEFSLFSWIHPFHPGDIVVFDSPDDYNKRYVKRVIALGPQPSPNTVAAGAQNAPDDSVSFEIDDGKIYVNHSLVKEPYLPPNVDFGRDNEHTVIHAGQMFVMGDNRGVSKDSRTFGPIEDNKIIGRAVLRFWPLSRFGFL